MLKRLVNHADIVFRIELIDPLLIKSGQATVAGVDMSFVRTYRRGKPEPFLPGSSLKGAVRAHAERICRTLRPGCVCLPYVQPGKAADHERDQESCGFRLDQVKKNDGNAAFTSAEAYRRSCAACRLFGSVKFGGRAMFSDGYLTEGSPATLETRDGIAIDRFSGGVAGGAKFDLEVLSAATFESRLTVRNFELWQLALIGLVLQDMQGGLVRLGSGKSRGLGRVTLHVDRFELAYCGAGAPGALCGLWQAASESERQAYGLHPEGPGPELPATERRGIRHVCDIAPQWPERLDPLVGELEAFLNTSAWPAAFTPAVVGA